MQGSAECISWLTSSSKRERKGAENSRKGWQFSESGPGVPSSALTAGPPTLGTRPASHCFSAKDKDAAKLVLSVTDRTASARESRSTCCNVVASLAARKFGLYNAVPQNYNFDTKSELHLGNSFEAYSLARLQHQNIRRTPPKLTGHRSTFDHLDSKDFRTLPFAA